MQILWDFGLFDPLPIDLNDQDILALQELVEIKVSDPIICDLLGVYFISLFLYVLGEHLLEGESPDEVVDFPDPRMSNPKSHFAIFVDVGVKVGKLPNSGKLHLVARDKLINIFPDIFHFIDFVFELLIVVDEDDIAREQLPIDKDLSRFRFSDWPSDLLGFLIVGDEFVPGFFIDGDILLVEVVFFVDDDVEIVVLWEFFRDFKELAVVGDDIGVDGRGHFLTHFLITLVSAGEQGFIAHILLPLLKPFSTQNVGKIIYFFESLFALNEEWLDLGALCDQLAKLFL